MLQFAPIFRPGGTAHQAKHTRVHPASKLPTSGDKSIKGCVYFCTITGKKVLTRQDVNQNHDTRVQRSSCSSLSNIIQQVPNVWSWQFVCFLGESALDMPELPNWMVQIWVPNNSLACYNKMNSKSAVSRA